MEEGRGSRCQECEGGFGRSLGVVGSGCRIENWGTLLDWSTGTQSFQYGLTLLGFGLYVKISSIIKDENEESRVVGNRS